MVLAHIRILRHAAQLGLVSILAATGGPHLSVRAEGTTETVLSPQRSGASGAFGLDAYPTTRPTPLGNRKQLMVDDAVIASKEGVRRELGTVVKANQGKPIFTAGRFYGTVLHDEGRFILWYRKPGSEGYGYAESDDGEHFRVKADLTGIPFAGDYTLAVIKDPHERDRAHQYKAAFDGPGMAAALAHSPDGIRWTTYNDGKPVTGRAADTYNQIVWDPLAGLYRLFTRTDVGTPGGATEIRGTRGMVNPDVKAAPTAWKTVRSWHFNREGREEHKRRQIYAMTDWIHEGIHFALMNVYEWPGDAGEGPEDLHKRHERDVMNLYLATSRDGDNWDLTWVYAGQPLIPRGPDGAFDKDTVLSASEVVTHRDQHWLYYCGADERHGTENVRYNRQMLIGLAKLPLDRFVSLAAGDKPGTVLTKPLPLGSEHLEINVDARSGSCAVELVSTNGEAIEGFGPGPSATLRDRDELRWVPRWPSGDISRWRGRLVCLRFHLTHAKLYAFTMAPSKP